MGLDRQSENVWCDALFHRINRRIATKVDSTYLSYKVYVFGERWVYTNDIEITSPMFT